MKILWIDSDTAYTSAIVSSFKNRTLSVQTAVTKQAAIRQLLIFQPECTVLEMYLPDGSGIEICRKIRAYSQMPILFLTTDLSAATAIRAFECGASDYIRKPCDSSELYCRIMNEYRLFLAMKPHMERELTINNLTIQLNSRRAFLNGEPLNLTPIEFNILLLLTENVNQTVSIDVFYESFWDSHEIRETSRVLQAHITNLRRKLKFQKDCNICITNLYGKGYELSINQTKK